MPLNLFKKNRAQLIAYITAVAIFISIVPTSSLADVSIVANKGITSDAISKKDAKKIFLGKTKSLGGISLRLADLPKDNDTRKNFYKTVVKKNPKKLKAYWAKIVFAGKGTPPKSFKSDTEVINWVASTSGAVGYVDSGAVNDSVKVLFTSN